MNISLSVRIRRLAPRSHLPPEEQNHPDQEGGAHNQRRSQCRQILEHAGLLSRPGSLAHSLLGIVTHPPARPAPAPTLCSSAGMAAVARPAGSGPATEAARDRARAEAVPIAQAGTGPGARERMRRRCPRAGLAQGLSGKRRSA
jgi:hypothetical protein